MVRYGLVWFGMVWFGLVWFDIFAKTPGLYLVPGRRILDCGPVPDGEVVHIRFFVYFPLFLCLKIGYIALPSANFIFFYN